jgi:hypothetical protein
LVLPTGSPAARSPRETRAARFFDTRGQRRPQRERRLSRNGHTGSLAALALLVAALAPAAAVTIDDFDDNTTDTTLWTVANIGSGVSVQEINQRLEVTLAADAAGSFAGGYWSKLAYGDVDVAVSFSLLDWPTKNGVRVGLFLIADSTPTLVPTASWAAERVSGGAIESFSDVYLTDFNHSIGVLVGTADTTGALRIARVGNTISAWYLANGAWQLLRSDVVAPAGELYFGFAAWSHDQYFADQPVKVAFDDIRLVPEPSASALLLSALAPLVFRRRAR